MSVNHPNRSLALIFQDEKKLSKRWKLDLGVRFDTSAHGSTFVSRRAALLCQPYQWSLKFLYGRSFSNPRAYELFYFDGVAGVANPNAHAEVADTLEVDVR